jgi:hypothetical protein
MLVLVILRARGVAGALDLQAGPAPTPSLPVLLLALYCVLLNQALSRGGGGGLGP